MPTSQYFYADTDAKQIMSGPVASTRRRSQRIHRKSLDKAQQEFRASDGEDDCLADPDETILDDDKDETILLSFDEDVSYGGRDDLGGSRKHDSAVDGMDVDRHEVNGKSRCRQQPFNEIPKVIRRENGGFLSDDPLTSSTIKTTPFNDMRAKSMREASAMCHAQISTTERLRRLANQFSSDESDDENSVETSEQQFFVRGVEKSRAQHEAMLAESHPHTQPSMSVGQHDSDDTEKIVNHNESSSFNSTQTWEREIRDLDLQCHDQLNRSQLNQICNHPSQQRNSELPREISASRTNHREVIQNPYLRKEPFPPPQKLATNVPKISSEQSKSQQQVHVSKRETWQEEAFRSSLRELLESFPSHYFNFQEDASTTGNQTQQLATENDIDDESPHSTTSQRAASSQLNRQRLFDAASRCLARFAIASRHGASCGSSQDDGAKEKSPNFDPPSPRSLPAYMSVMNVYDDSSCECNPTYVGGRHSNGVFSGRSVYGRSARTLHLAGTPQEQRSPSSNNLYSSCSLEQLAFGSMVLAAQVCYESSSDRCVDEKEHCCHSNIATKSGRVDASLPVSLALVGSSLGFLATAFACLGSDIVYSALKAPLKTSDSFLPVTVFDALCDFAPVSTEVASRDDLSNNSTLSLLALSRGFEAVIDVARHSSMDPSSTCTSYTSPHDIFRVSDRGTIDTGMDKSGVGWLSAVGRDLGLKLEDPRNSRPRHVRLSEIAIRSYDFVLSYNPMGVDDGSYSSLMMSKQDDGGNKKRSNCRSDLLIDIQDDNHGTSTFAVCQHAVIEDRLFAANAMFLTTMLHAGIVAGWLLYDPKHEDGRDLGDSHGLLRVNNLCQKLFNIIETVARRRRSVQTNALPDPGDSEAVCASSLSLLLFALPKYDDQSPSVSISISIRQMGNNSGSVEDLLHSPLIRNMVELALSWQSSNEDTGKSIDVMKSLAAINAMYRASELCMVGGTSWVCTHFRDKLNEFLRNLTLMICGLGKITIPRHSCDYLSFGSSLLLLLNLHSGSPIVIRQFLRNFIEISSANGDDYAKYFVIGLLRLAIQSYSVSSCASSLLRALIDGNPADRTRDRLSLMLLSSFDADNNISTAEHALRLLIECAYTTRPYNPCYIAQHHPRKCVLGDLLNVCIHTHAISIFASSLSDDVLGQFLDTIKWDHQDSLTCAVTLTLINLFVLVANKQCDDIDDLAQEKQKRTKERLRTIIVSVMTILELALSQGTSVDITERALKLQTALLSLSDERFVALCITNANSSVAIRDKMLRDQLAKSQLELSEMAKRNQNILLKYDNLTHAHHDQRLAYERQIEYFRSELRISARHESEILADERKQAEDQCAKERVARLRAEEKLERSTRESSNYQSRIKEIEDLLSRECKVRKDTENQLEMCKTELSKSSMELERISSNNLELEDKLTISEDKVAELTAITKVAESDLEDAYSKLIQLATVYKSKELDMEKFNAELRIAMTAANKHADKATAKYEKSKKQNSLLAKQLEEVTAELDSTKNYRANVQRMRKNAPVAYLNQLHYSGKENTYDER